MEAPIVNHANEEVGKVSLDDGIFATDVNDALL